jgi:MFS transporter, FSR family, fosmidomycin resistance protein
MAQTVESSATVLTQEKTGTKDTVMATGLISAHGLEHLYGRGFLAVVPSIYETLGLVNYQAGLMDAVRALSSGLTSMGSGFFTDIFQHRRAQILAISMGLIGIGYLLVAVSPTYAILLVALLLPSAGSALWHPPALAMLAQRFPHRRGFLVAFHRSTGNVGDAIAPIVVATLLGIVSWRLIIGGGTPMLILLAILIPIFLRSVGAHRWSQQTPAARDTRAQFQSLKQAFKGGGVRAISPIFAVSALHGMGDRAFLWIVPLYLVQDLGRSYLFMGVHLALLQAGAIVAGPLLGALSDRIGRKSITVYIMLLATVLPVTMVLSNGGIGLTISVALFGLFAFSVNSLSQAAAIDIVSGRRLEGTFIGLMWGVNAFFGAATAVASGFLADAYGREVAFYTASALFFVGFLASLFMPGTKYLREQAA